MSKKIELVLKGISEIVGNSELCLLVLTDVSESRQISVVCDKDIETQFAIRRQQLDIAKYLLPEVLCRILRQYDGLDCDIIINNVVEGQYKTYVFSKKTLDMIPIRISDAVLLSFVANLKIYIDEALMSRQSVPYRPELGGVSIPINALSDKMLEQALNKAIEEEDYKLASYLRDEKQRRSGKKPS